MLQTTKMSFEKPLGEQVFKNPQLQVCPSAPSLVFFVSLITALSGYLYVSSNLVAVHNVRILINLVTQLL